MLIDNLKTDMGILLGNCGLFSQGDEDIWPPKRIIDFDLIHSEIDKVVFADSAFQQEAKRFYNNELSEADDIMFSDKVWSYAQSIVSEKLPHIGSIEQTAVGWAILSLKSGLFTIRFTVRPDLRC